MSGLWTNKLLSTMEISLNKETQNFVGKYCSNVGIDQEPHKGTVTGHMLSSRDFAAQRV
ncbi:avidin/streptavidin family protein [Photorhabdus namnaonensis]|uniref:avidin/streptavidin family protein n=1 Tax=Photorhabdus namnaonensis TaxID=1851568 RepID=UPI003B848EBE